VIYVGVGVGKKHGKKIAKKLKKIENKICERQKLKQIYVQDKNLPPSHPPRNSAPTPI